MNILSTGLWTYWVLDHEHTEYQFMNILSNGLWTYLVPVYEHTENWSMNILNTGSWTYWIPVYEHTEDRSMNIPSTGLWTYWVLVFEHNEYRSMNILRTGPWNFYSKETKLIRIIQNINYFSIVIIIWKKYMYKYIENPLYCGGIVFANSLCPLFRNLLNISIEVKVVCTIVYYWSRNL